MIGQSQKNENQYTKTLLFALAEDEEWEEDLGAWRHKAFPVYRAPQGEWTEFTEHKSRWIYFLPKTISGAPEPDDMSFPEWIECRWDAQAGRWVILSPGGGGGSQFDVRIKPDGSALEKTFDGGTTWIKWADIFTCE